MMCRVAHRYGKSPFDPGFQKQWNDFDKRCMLEASLEIDFDIDMIAMAVSKEIPKLLVDLADIVGTNIFNALVAPKSRKKHLVKNNNKVIIKKGAYYPAHVIGCQSQAFDKSADSLLLLSDGKFHALNNAIQLKKEIYVFTTKTLEKLEEKDLQEYYKKIKAKQNLFLNAEKVGILVSTKQGQCIQTQKINQIKKSIEKLNKEVYIFESNNINIAEFENFPEISF